MTQSDVDTIRGAYEAFGRGDIPAVLEAFDPEIDWNTPESLPYGGHFRGHEEVTGFFQGIPEHIDDLSVAPSQFLDAGDHVVVTGELSGRGKGGAEFTAAFAMVWQMRDGKAVAFHEYTDSAPVVEATQKQTA